MPTHYNQISLESMRRVLTGGGACDVIQMPAPAAGIAGSAAGNGDQAQRLLPTLVAKCRPAGPAETPARPTSGGERWRQLAEAASREQDPCTLLKLVEDLVRELPDAAPVQRKNANVERNNATAREIVGKAFPDAYCANSGGLFQIRRPLDNASPARVACLSSQHVTAEEAWYFAATRVLSDEAARLGSESNKEVVLATFPSAYCAVVRCGYFEIQRPRTRSDKESVLKYMPLSGRFSVEYFAWQDAAQSLVDSGATEEPEQESGSKCKCGLRKIVIR